MPIRINLLAEAQATEELRRKDPVKRSIWIGGFCVALVLLWMLELQCDVFFAQRSYINKFEQWNAISSKYAAVTNNSLLITEINVKLAALDHLHTNRFLWAPVLNALQKTTVPDVELTALHGTQTITVDAEHRDNIFKTSLYLEGRDNNSDAQNYNKYKEGLCNSDFFVKHFRRRDGFVLDQLSTPAPDPANPSRQVVTFTLASHFPEERRHD